MAPKRGRKKVAQVVKTTKVVEETVQVSILGTESQEEGVVHVAEIAEKAQSPTTVSERREEQTIVTTKTIPIEEAETETQEPDIPLDEPHFEKIGTPPREEAKPKQEEASDESRPSKRAKKQNEAGKSVPTPSEKGAAKNKRKGRRMKEGYKSYVFKVLKQVHPGLGVSGKAMTIINNLMSDMFERLAFEAGKLGMHAKKNTLSAREIQAAVKLVLPGELGKHAIAEGNKAVTNYINYHNN